MLPLAQKSGLIEQRKGPHGGAKLKLPAKQIGLGDVYLATEGDWLVLGDPAIAGLLKRVRAEGVLAMNETTVAQMLKADEEEEVSGCGVSERQSRQAVEVSTDGRPRQ